MTKHEIEILNVMRSRGKTAMDIALILQISVNTVRSYIRRHHIQRKYDFAPAKPRSADPPSGGPLGTGDH